MNNISIITDTHWGVRSDSSIFIEYYRKFYDNIFFPKLIENKISTILMLGDTFDRRKYTNHISLYHAKKIYFDRLEQLDIKVYMLVGNHDIAYKNTNMINCPELFLKEYKNIEIIHSPTTIEIDDTKICMIPWITEENEADSMWEIKNTQAEILCGHLEVAGFSMYRGHVAEEGLSPKIFDKFDLVCSGHYHTRSNKGNIYYLGNPHELTWSDYDDPRGFHFFDLDTRKLEFIENTYKMFYKLEYDDTKDIVDLNSLELQDMIVKLIVIHKTDPNKFDKFIQKLYTKNCFDIKIIEDLSEYNNGELAEEIDLSDTLSILSNYIHSIDTDLDKVSIDNYMKVLFLEAQYQEVV